jgi:hypothetical protein
MTSSDSILVAKCAYPGCKSMPGSFMFDDMKKIFVNKELGICNCCMACFGGYIDRIAAMCGKCKTHYPLLTELVHVRNIKKFLCKNCYLFSNFISHENVSFLVEKVFVKNEYSSEDIDYLEKIGEIIILQWDIYHKIRNDPKRRLLFQRMIDFIDDVRMVNRIGLLAILYMPEEKIERFWNMPFDNATDFYLELYRE